MSPRIVYHGARGILCGATWLTPASDGTRDHLASGVELDGTRNAEADPSPGKERTRCGRAADRSAAARGLCDSLYPGKHKPDVQPEELAGTSHDGYPTGPKDSVAIRRSC